MEGIACGKLEVKRLNAKTELGFQIQSSDPCAVGIGTGEENVAVGISSLFPEEEHVLKIRIEPFGGKIEFAVAKRVVPIGTECRAMRVLRSEIRIKADERYIASDGCDVQVFVISLRSTVAATVPGTQNESAERRVTQRGTRSDNRPT